MFDNINDRKVEVSNNSWTTKYASFAKVFPCPLKKNKIVKKSVQMRAKEFLNFIYINNKKRKL